MDNFFTVLISAATTLVIYTGLEYNRKKREAKYKEQRVEKPSYLWRNLDYHKAIAVSHPELTPSELPPKFIDSYCFHTEATLAPLYVFCCTSAEKEEINRVKRMLALAAVMTNVSIRQEFTLFDTLTYQYLLYLTSNNASVRYNLLSKFPPLLNDEDFLKNFSEADTPLPGIEDIFPHVEHLYATIHVDHPNMDVIVFFTHPRVREFINQHGLKANPFWYQSILTAYHIVTDFPINKTFIRLDTNTIRCIRFMFNAVDISVKKPNLTLVK